LHAKTKPLVLVAGLLKYIRKLPLMLLQYDFYFYLQEQESQQPQKCSKSK
jgi:hypothetical protein